MGTYLASTFLASYSPGDVVLKFVNKNNNRTFGLNVCQYEKSSIEGNEVWILIHDKIQKILDFDTTTEAETALVTLQNTINSLLPNCAFVGSTPAAPPQSVVAITYTQYQTLQSTNSLALLQWYDVSDTGPVFNLGPVVRLQAKTTSDYQPSGLSLTTNELVVINTLDNTIQRREDSVNKVLALNRSTISHTASTFLKASTFSNITAVGSNYIEVENHSTVQVNNSEHVKAINESNLVLDDVNNAFFDNIQEDLSAFVGVFNDITVNPTNSLGKQGKETLSTTDNETLLAYINLVDLHTPTLTASISKILENPIPSANAEFKINVGSGLGAFSLVIKDSAATTLATVTSALAGSILTFRWNKTSLLFEFVANTQTINITQIPVGLNGQTTFTGLVPVPSDPAISELLINGQVQIYGALKDYSISGNVLTWLDRHFTLKTTDEVILRYK